MRKLWLALCLIPTLAWAQVPFQFPAPTSPNAIPRTPSTSGTTGAISASIVGAPNKWSYLCGFVITSGGTTTATTVSATVVGIQAQQNFAYNFPSTGQGLLGVAYPACLVSATQNTSITVAVPAGGTGTVDALSLWGFVN